MIVVPLKSNIYIFFHQNRYNLIWFPQELKMKEVIHIEEEK
jgi:hypothetical protein